MLGLKAHYDKLSLKTKASLELHVRVKARYDKLKLRIEESFHPYDDPLLCLV
jgi:hypothetical protein